MKKFTNRQFIRKINKAKTLLVINILIIYFFEFDALIINCDLERKTIIKTLNLMFKVKYVQNILFNKANI
jgi:hypothetical protein